MKVTEKAVLDNGYVRYLLTENFWAIDTGKYGWSFFQVNKNGKSRQLPSHNSKQIYCIKQAISNFETKE